MIVLGTAAGLAPESFGKISLVVGFVLLFAIVVMPGIGTLQNREFLQAFQVIDKVIPNNQPLDN